MSTPVADQFADIAAEERRIRREREEAQGFAPSPIADEVHADAGSIGINARQHTHPMPTQQAGGSALWTDPRVEARIKTIAAGHDPDTTEGWLYMKSLCGFLCKMTSTMDGGLE